MIHLFRLMMLNITSTTNSDKIRIARENKLHDSAETKLVFFAIIGLIISYLVYWITVNFLLPLKQTVLVLAFIVACLIVLVSNIANIKSVLIYKVEDDFLFSLPLSSTEIIISKLFTTYIKNLIYIIIIMFPPYYALKSSVSISETSSLIYLLTGLTLPLIPIMIGTIYAFIDSYYNQGIKKKKYNIVRILILLLIISAIYFLFNKVDTSNINSVVTRLTFINPFIYLFKTSILKNNIITTLLLIFLPVIIFSFFIKHLSVNYTYLLSRIRGVKLSKNKEIKVAKKKNKVGSIIHKELLTLFNNKTYFRSSIYFSISLMVSYLIITLITDPIENSKLHDFGIYLMFFLSFAAASSCTTINSLSLEKSNIVYFKSLPIKFSKILLSKFLVNILTSLPIIIVNFLITLLFYKVSKFTYLFLIINPLLLTIFISLLGLILDFRFIAFKEKDSNNIIKNRLITYVPLLASLLVIGIIFLINPADDYNFILLAFSAINIFLILLSLFYLLINYKRILNTNIK